MATINQLSAVDSLQGGDQIPVYDASNGDARKASMATVLDYIESNFASPDFNTRVLAPSVDGFNVDVGNTGTSTWLIIQPTSDFTIGSVTLPPATSAANDQVVIVVLTKEVANFSITSVGATVLGAPTQIEEYTAFSVRYNSSQATWYTLDNSGAGAGGTSNIVAQDFIGDGVTTTFTMTAAPTAAGEGLQVFIDGVYQNRDTYSLSGLDVVFTQAPPLNSEIEVLRWDVNDIGATTANLVSYTPAGNNAVLRTVEEKLRETVSVKDFGAVGDGVTDDTAAIQAALDAGAGNKVIIPKGVYLLTSGLDVPNRTQVTGDGPINSYLIYKVSTTTANSAFNFDNNDNIHLSDFTIFCNTGSGSQNTTGIKLQGDAGAVTEVHLDRVYIDNFQSVGVFLNTDVYYFSMDRCRIINTSNAVSNGGTGSGNAIGLYIGATCNAIRINECRIALNDKAVDSSNSNKKYSININNCYFESNGEGAPSANSCIHLRKCSAVSFNGNYIEANLTGTSVDDSVLLLDNCKGVDIRSNIFAGTFGGIGKSKNLIGLKNACYGVVAECNELQDPITSCIYVADGNSVIKAHRNYYDAFGTPLQTYAQITNVISSRLVEIDVPHIQAISTGSVGAKSSYQTNITIPGVPNDRNCTIVATCQNGGADFSVTAAILGNDLVRLMFFNMDASPQSFTGNVAVRVYKNGSF